MFKLYGYKLLLQITFVDFVMYELLDQHLLFEPTILDDYPNLKVHSYVMTLYLLCCCVYRLFSSVLR